MGDKISAGGDSLSKRWVGASAIAHRHYFNEAACSSHTGSDPLRSCDTHPRLLLFFKLKKEEEVHVKITYRRMFSC